MLVETTELYIVDKSNKPMFRTLCTTAYYMSEYKNLEIKLMEAKKYPEAYSFLDLETAKIVVNHNYGEKK